MLIYTEPFDRDSQQGGERGEKASREAESPYFNFATLKYEPNSFDDIADIVCLASVLWLTFSFEDNVNSIT